MAGFHLGLARVLERKGKLDEAAEQCDQAIQLVPDKFEGYYYKAIVFKTARRFGEAIVLLEKALRGRIREPEMVNHARDMIAELKAELQK